MRRILLTGLAILWCAAMVRAQGAGDVLGMHNLGPGSKSPITGSRTDSCSYCHAPHSATNVGLWNQKLPTQTYTMYKSNTEKNTGIQPKPASARWSIARRAIAYEPSPRTASLVAATAPSMEICTST